MSGLEKNETGREESKSFVCPSPLAKIDIQGGGEHKVFNESSPCEKLC